MEAPSKRPRLIGIVKERSDEPTGLNAALLRCTLGRIVPHRSMLKLQKI
jgi:hypothetical protein